MRQQSLKAAITIVLIYALAVGGGLKQYYTNWNRDDWKSALETVMLEEQPGDAIAVFAPMSKPELAIDYYYDGPAAVHTIEHFSDQTSIEQSISNIPDESQRLWILIRGLNGNPKANENIAQAIENQFDLQSRQKFPGPVEVFLVTAKPLD